jgi:hypothetical protein
MKSVGYRLIVFWYGIILLKTLPIAFAQSEFIDPLNGDNRNPGISSAAPRKGSRSIVAAENEPLVRHSDLATQENSQPDYKTKVRLAADASSELERIILGSQAVSGWTAFAPTIWQAQAEWQQRWELISISIDGRLLQTGCSGDFLEDGQFYWQDNTLFINNTEGNPDTLGKAVTVAVYDNQTNADIELSITGWSSTTPAVWQAEFPTEPIHVFVNEMLFDQNWWYGPLSCETVTGQPGVLYLRDSDGNPDDTSKITKAVSDAGGWAVTAGDFNGDGMQDAAHSNSDRQIYINYGGSEFSVSPGQILTSPDGASPFGFYIASAGDVNNDGFEDLIVAMGWGIGKAYLYLGSQAGLNPVPALALSPPAGLPAYGFGHRIAGKGDINGDTFSDVLIMGGDDSCSYLCIYLGSDSGISENPDSVIQFTDKIYGGPVCIVGDMNGDGYDEVALSLSNAPPVNEIEIRVYDGTSTGRLENPRILQVDRIPERNTTAYGEVAPAGDVNSDGFADLIVGNQWAGGNAVNEGRAYLFLGSEHGAGDQPDLTVSNPVPEFDARFGSSVSGIGDFDRDGLDDFAVGCPYSRAGDGFIAIYSGSAMDLSGTPARTIEGANSLGWSLTGAGDINGMGQVYLCAGEEYGGSYLFALPSPSADAGTDQEVIEGTTVNIDGSASAPADPERQIVSYQWTQTSGPAVILSDPAAVRPFFLTPPVGTEGAMLGFQLMVEDSIGIRAIDEVTVSILDNGISGFPDDVLTLICATGQPIGIKVQGEAHLLKIVTIDPSILPSADNAPTALYGWFDITIEVPTSGATAEVLFYFPTPATDDQNWYRYNPDRSWADYSGHSAFNGDRSVVTIFLTDGAEGDDDYTPNGTIQDVSGIGTYATISPSSDDPPPASGGGGGGGGCFISIMNTMSLE